MLFQIHTCIHKLHSCIHVERVASLIDDAHCSDFLNNSPDKKKGFKSIHSYTQTPPDDSTSLVAILHACI